MMNAVVFVALALPLAASGQDIMEDEKSAAGQAFTYGKGDPYGPENWSKIPGSEVCGTGTRQSPAPVTSKNATKVNFLPMKFDNYRNVKIPATYLFNGHTLDFTLTTSNSTPAMISGGGFSGKYKLAKIHFHWGTTSAAGSEHSLEDKLYPLEMHIIHVKDIYSSVTAALASKAGDALAVLGVMFQVSPTANPYLTQIVQLIRTNTTTTGTAQIVPFPLLPTDTSKFFRYNGSLTTPTCNEAVVWTVFKDIQKVTAAQLVKFRSLYKFNNRPLQYGARTSTIKVLDVTPALG